MKTIKQILTLFASVVIFAVGSQVASAGTSLPVAVIQFSPYDDDSPTFPVPQSENEIIGVYGIAYDDGSVDIHFLQPVGTAAIALYDEDDDLAGLWQKANGATKVTITLPDAEGEYEILVQLQNGASYVANYAQ